MTSKGTNITIIEEGTIGALSIIKAFTTTSITAASTTIAIEVTGISTITLSNNDDKIIV